MDEQRLSETPPVPDFSKVCPVCDGYGYTYGNYNDPTPDDCDACGGTGRIWEEWTHQEGR